MGASGLPLFADFHGMAVSKRLQEAVLGNKTATRVRRLITISRSRPLVVRKRRRCFSGKENTVMSTPAALRFAARQVSFTILSVLSVTGIFVCLPIA
jgi:hypothetical protein